MADLGLPRHSHDVSNASQPAGKGAEGNGRSAELNASIALI